MLLAANADVNTQKTDTGMTPLMFAAHAGNLGIVKSLMAHHADVSLRNKEGEKARALAEAAHATDAAKLLEGDHPIH